MNGTIFTKKLDQKQLNITREFNGPLDMVWKALTDSELLDQWWAPRPWKAGTKHMDFSEGGYWLYFMKSPEGEKHWSRVDFLKIVLQKMFKSKDYFTDDEGVITPWSPTLLWEVSFTKSDNGTRVDVMINFDSKEDLEKIVEMGFKEGFAAAHKNLDELLTVKTN